MFRIALLFLCLLLNGQNEAPTFRARTQLVELTVVAVDKKGNPVVDLKAGDFTLLDNGKPREIAFFRFEGDDYSTVGANRPKMPPHVFSNRLELTGASGRNITVLLIDSVNTGVEDQMMVKAQSMMFLRALAPKTLVAVFQLGQQFRVLHDFTDDMGSLRAGLEKIKVEFPSQSVTDIERIARDADEFLEQMPRYKAALEVARMRAAVATEVNFNSFVRSNRAVATMELLESLAGHIAGIPGRKSVVWITGGVGMFVSSVGPTGQFMTGAGGADLKKAIQRTSEHLAQAGVALYAVDAHGLMVPWFAATRSRPLNTGSPMGPTVELDGYGQDTRAAFGLMTSVTGGRYFVNNNDFSEGIRKANADVRGTYSLGFYVGENSDGKWRTLKAVVNRPGIELLHRQGYRAEDTTKQQPDWSQERTRWALRNPLGSSAIRLNAHCSRASSGEPVTLALQIEAEDLWLREVGDRWQSELEVTIGEKSAVGSVRFQQDLIRLNFTAQQAATARERGIPYRKQWRPDASTSVVRVLVRDKATGRFGTVDVQYD